MINTSPELVINSILGNSEKITEAVQNSSLIIPSDMLEELGLEEDHDAAKEILIKMQLMFEFARINGQDPKKIVAELKPYAVNAVSDFIEHLFSRLELVAENPDTYVNAYKRVDHTLIVLRHRKDGSEGFFHDIYFPCGIINENEHRIIPSDVVNSYKKHKAEVLDLNVNYCLRDAEDFFNFSTELAKSGLNDIEIIKKLYEGLYETKEKEIAAKPSFTL